MSNVGQSPTLAPDTPPVTSHTSTQQWQSFEFRMRHRRAERCLLRAEIALEAGFEDDAREALDEAERLHSENPKLGELKAILAERDASAATVVAPPLADQPTNRGRVVQTVAAALIFLGVGTGAYLFTRNDAPDVAPTTGATATASDSNPGSKPSAPIPQVTVPSIPAVSPPVPSDPAATAASTPASAAAVGQTDTRTPLADAQPINRAPVSTEADRSAGATQPKAALPAFNPQFAEARPVTLPPASQAVDTASLRTAAPPTPEPPPVIPETPAAAPASTLDRMGERLPASNLPPAERRPAPEKPAAADRPAVVDNPPPPPVNEEPRIRAVLARYEAAYSGLNASAAQAVWPGVDERSLARAFDTLQSQDVSLGRCAVQVAGATASASCDGQVTWTPKVGGRSQTAARQWRFQLHNGNGNWQITRADVR